MPVRKQLLETPLTSGLQQKSDDRIDTIDTAEVMTNCVRTKAGGVRKRIGCKRQPSGMRRGPVNIGSEIGSVRGVNYGRSALHFDGAAFTQFSDTENTWTLIDATPEAVASNHIPVISTLTSTGLFQGADMDSGGSLNYHVVANTGNMSLNTSTAAATSNITTTVIDGSSGAVVQPALAIDNYNGVNQFATFPKVIICGNTAIVAWQRVGGATPGLYLSKLDLTNINSGWSAPFLFDNTIITGATSEYDITPIVGDATRFVLGYFVTTGGNMKVVKVNVASLAILNTFTSPGTGGPVSIAVLATLNEWCWVGYIKGAGGFYISEAWAFNDATNVQASVVNWGGGYPTGGFGQMGLARVSASSAVMLYSIFDVVGPPIQTAIYGQQLTVTGAVTATTGTARRTGGVILASKPAVLFTPAGTRCYAMVIVPSQLQGTQALACFDWFGSGAANFGSGTAADCPARLVATVAPRLAKGVYGFLGTGTLGSAYPFRMSNILAAGQSIATLTYVNTSVQRLGIYIQPFNFSSQLRYFGATLAGSDTLGLSAGAPFTFDGQSPSEMGFLWYPEQTNVNSVAGALTGAYSYIITYEWTDAAGNIHRSATSPPINVVLASQNAVLTLPTIGITWRQRHAPTVLSGNSVFQNQVQNVKICIYGTTASGTIYYFIASVNNDTSVPTVSYTDGTGGVTTSPLLYTTGGVLDNYIPPSARICITHKNRWWLSGCDDPTVIWPSKAFTSGEVPGFNEQMNIYASGNVTALASMDEKLIVFVRRGTDQYGIEYIVGEGPFDTGASNDWTNPPQPIPAAVGALDQRSIVVGEFGCMFMSPVGAPNGGGGIFLLSRDLQVQYASGPVEDYIVANPVCAGAVIHPSAGRIYFEMIPLDALSTGITGVRLVFDYIMQSWSVDSHYAFDQSIDFAAARATWVAGGAGVTANGTVNMPLVYWSDVTGAVYRENSGFATTNAYIDQDAASGVHWITATFTSAWFKPALSGFARFWRAQVQANSLDPARLTVSFQFDYSPASFYTETFTWTDAQIATFNRFPQVDVEHLVGNQKAKAIQVTLVDAAPVGSYSTGQGFQWSTLSLEIGVEDQGRYMNLPPGQRS